MLQEYWRMGFRAAGEGYIPGEIFSSAMSHFFRMLGPTAVTAVVAAVTLNLLQNGGFFFSLEAMHFGFSNMNPAQGIKRLFSLRSLVELVKSIFKLIIVGFAVYSILHKERETLLSTLHMEMMQLVVLTSDLATRILVRAGGIMFFVSLLDFFYQKWQTGKDLMMTKQETKEEHKQSEGNPQVKSRIRAIQRALSRRRMLSKVPKAGVVITNPTHYAVALEYKAGMDAPIVVAKGMDFLAQKIIKIARENRVSVVQNPPLARALYSQVKLDAAIPLALYKAVAKVLAYVYRQQKKSGR